MMNFLTPRSDLLKPPDTNAAARLCKAIDQLMTRVLVPGGTILVLGGTSGDYQDIYRDLDSHAAAAHLSVVAGFEAPPQAGRRRPEELAAICALARRLWRKLEACR